MSSGPDNPWLHRYAIFLAICTLFLMVLGAAVTSYRPQSPAAPSSDTAALEQLHRTVAFAVTGLTLVLVVWLSLAAKRGGVRWLGWAVLAIVILAVAGGEQMAAQRLPGAMPILHAYLAQLLFAAMVAMAVITSASWQRSSELVADRFSLRAMGLIVPAFVFIQIGLGAAYRHQAMGVLTHIFGAMVVAVFVLLVGVLAVKQYPQHRSLRPAAITLMSITGAQVLLGFAAFITRLMTTKATLAVVISTVAHVTTGALTLAASVILAIYIGREIRGSAAVKPESSPTPVHS